MVRFPFQAQCKTNRFQHNKFTDLAIILNFVAHALNIRAEVGIEQTPRINKNYCENKLTLSLWLRSFTSLRNRYHHFSVSNSF